jgi:3-dehydroquinate dehydratase-1
MKSTKSIELRGKALSGGKLPLICTPLIGRTGEAIESELAKVTPKAPDLIEWRVDFFDGIADIEQVIDMARSIKAAARGIPILFTRRSIREGGESIPLTEDHVVEMYCAVCRSGTVDFIDFEMSNATEHIRQLRQVSRQSDIKMVMSYHNFRETPALDVLFQRFVQAQEQGADAAKVAVMPTRLEDVLALLSATLKAAQELQIPVISMSMGSYGSLSRMFGWVFGSAVTFAVGDGSSAPGQVPIEDLSAVIGIVRKAVSAT